MAKVTRKKKQIAGRSSHFLQTTATKVIKFNAVAGLHSIALSYAELIDHGNAATIQTLQYLYGVFPGAI